MASLSNRTMSLEAPDVLHTSFTRPLCLLFCHISIIKRRLLSFKSNKAMVQSSVFLSFNQFDSISPSLKPFKLRVSVDGVSGFSHCLLYSSVVGLHRCLLAARAHGVFSPAGAVFLFPQWFPAHSGKLLQLKPTAVISTF